VLGQRQPPPPYNEKIMKENFWKFSENFWNLHIS
jgi:hypothetical protein